jgi:hypothetical protein
MGKGDKKAKSSQKKLDDSFFMHCEGVPCYKLCEKVSEFYNCNILVYDDIKDKEIFGTVRGGDLNAVLYCISWLLGCEYVIRDGIVFLGSNSRTVLVLPSSGIDQRIEHVFKDVSVKQLGDKIVVTGSERDVARVKQAYDKILKRSYAVVHLYAIELLYDNNIEFGFDIDKALEYSFSWEGLIESMGNPIQHLVMSFSASLEAGADKFRISSVIDTDIGLLSGKEVNFQIGEDNDRPIYSESTYGEQSRVISGYNTQHTGLILKLKGYYDQLAWYVDFSVENSEAKSDLKKTLTILNTVAKLNEENPVQILAKLNLGTVKQTYEKGLPFLCEIPVLGYLFRITKERKMRKQLVFVLTLKNPKQRLVIPEHYKFNGLVDLHNDFSLWIGKKVQLLQDSLIKK